MEVFLAASALVPSTQPEVLVVTMVVVVVLLLLAALPEDWQEELPICFKVPSVWLAKLPVMQPIHLSILQANWASTH